MVRCYAGVIENDRGCTRYQSAGRAHRRRDISRRKQFVRDQTGCRGGNASITCFVEDDCEVAKSDGRIGHNAVIIRNAGASGDTIENPTERIKAGLRTRATVPIRRKTVAGRRPNIG